MQKLTFWTMVGLFILSGCSVNLSGAGAATPTLFVITSTLPASLPPAATLTPPPAPPTPTQKPVEGTTTTQVYVRSDPSSAGSQLGIIDLFAQVQILGKDPSGNWYQIAYAKSPNGNGWVSAKYVQVQDAQSIPTIGGTTDSSGGLSGVITQQVNIRSGPGTTFDSVATLNPNDVVTLTGKNSDGTWLQIIFKQGQAGPGWVSAGYVQAGSLDKLPIVAQSGETIGTGTPTSIPATITPTLIAAPEDGDSANAPAAKVSFSASGTRSLIYGSSVSAPDGDRQDWIQFTPYTGTVVASLTCAGNGNLKVDLYQDGTPVQDWSGLACGDQDKILQVKPGQAYLLQITAEAGANSLVFVQYNLTIETQP